jgi:hypothetical protein
MARAIFVVGNSGTQRLFYLNTIPLKHFLMCELRMRDIAVILAHKFDAKSFECVLRETIARGSTRGEPLLLVYKGHGLQGGLGWQIGEREPEEKTPPRLIFSYESLAEILASYPGPICFLNDCCFAFSVVRTLEVRITSSHHFGIIASSDAEHESMIGNTFFPRIVEYWRARRFPFTSPSTYRSLQCPDFDFRWSNRLSNPGSGAIAAESSSPEDFVRFPYRRWGGMLDYYFFPEIR